jgi:hypothetical protein
MWYYTKEVRNNKFKGEIEMDNGAFGNGIEPGGLKNLLEIKILISYILSVSGPSVDEEILGKAVLSEGLANYFDFSASISDLLRNGQLKRLENGELALSESGKGLSREFYKMVPYSVREKCAKACLKMIARKKSEMQNKTSIEKREDGYAVSMEICDIGTSLFKLDLLLPDENTAKCARELFLSDTDNFYAAIMALLSGDSSIAEGIFNKDK